MLAWTRTFYQCTPWPRRGTEVENGWIHSPGIQLKNTTCVLESEFYACSIEKFPFWIFFCWRVILLLLSIKGSLSIQNITLQIFLVSKRYILVVNFGKNVQKGREGGGHLQFKKFLCQFLHIYKFLQKKRNEISKSKGEFNGRLDFFQKNRRFGPAGRP